MAKDELLSPGSEGKKCRPLGHTRQISFINFTRSASTNNLYVYTENNALAISISVVRSSVSWCGANLKIAHVPL